ncbi:DUF1629 domain-containing protein [Mesorhizobium sp. NZP2077]|nr:DUF1629 domain-containing protein [Mesorhizobium sp. NZP2077]
MVSERLKTALEETDKEAVVFAECEVYHISGKPIEPKHYLCDVTREIDAVDEASSTLKIEYHQGVKIYDLSGRSILNLKLESVGSAHIFRLKNTALVVCDASVRDTCIAAGIKDPELFTDISAY